VTEVKQTKPQRLRIHRAPQPQHSTGTVAPPHVDRFCKKFAEVTGWPLKYLDSEAALPPAARLWQSPLIHRPRRSSRLAIGRPDAGCDGRIDLQHAADLADCFAALLAQWEQAITALQDREAELAAGVPIVARSGDAGRLAERLEAVLEAGAASVGCQAAGLYLLDAATTELKLRATWGLPAERLTAPARPLPDAIADLEAMSGHAVVLEDDTLAAYWNVPEPCAAAVCVPISSPSTVLGTLWIFSDESRPFSDDETNRIEIVAGRLAADLEREMLLAEGVESERLRRNLQRAELLQQSQLPTQAPIVDGWEISGLSRAPAGLAGSFYDWWALDSGPVVALLGDAAEKSVAASLVATSTRAAIRAHAEYQSSSAKTLQAANRTLLSGSAGDQYAATGLARLEPKSGRVDLSLAGNVRGMVLHESGWRLLSGRCLPLGVLPEAAYESDRLELAPGETLILYTESLRDAQDHDGHTLGDEGLAHSLLLVAHQSADQISAAAGAAIGEFDTQAEADDLALMVISRR